MSYQPPSEPGGGQSGQGGYSDQPQSGNTQPVGSGGYSQPPSGGGYNPPAGGDYSPPPSGGYSPPQGGGYNPPPAGGGYGGPPVPPPAGPGGMGNMGGMNQAGLASLAQSWLNALTKPNVSTYEGEMRNASWVKVLIGLALVAVLGFIVNLLTAGASASMFNSAIDQARQQGNLSQVQMLESMRGLVGGGGVGGAFGALVLPFISFFIGAGVLYLTAKLFGGQGTDFLTHSYLLSLSYTPTRLIGTLLTVVPVVGSCISLLLYLYQIYSAGLAMQASQRMQPGRAQMAAWLPWIVGLVFVCLATVLCAGVLGAALSGASNK